MLLFLLMHVCGFAASPDAAMATAAAEYAELQRLNSPFGLPPVALLVREHDQRSDLQRALHKLAGDPERNAFVLYLTPGYGLWEIFGVPSGFVGSDRPTPLHAYLTDNREGYVFILGAIDYIPHRELIDGVMDAIRQGWLATASGARPPLRNNAIVLEVQDTDFVAPGMTVADLHLHADRSTRFEGYRLDVFTGFHMRALLGPCKNTLSTP